MTGISRVAIIAAVARNGVIGHRHPDALALAGRI